MLASQPSPRTAPSLRLRPNRPTFIKLAQALSIRTDLIPEAYALQLRQLQDAVPAFDSDQARAIIARELISRELHAAGAEGLDAIFTTLSHEPLAAASIGQARAAPCHAVCDAVCDAVCHAVCDAASPCRLPPLSRCCDHALTR